MPSTPAAAEFLFTTTNNLEAEGWRVRAFDLHGSTVYVGATCGGGAP